MNFTGFEEKDFKLFQIAGLEERMTAIQENIQPKFKAIGEELAPYLSQKLNQEMYVHIAKHARRTVNPPDDTWMAFSYNKRGYKKHPHFQIGLWDDRVFVWLAYIYELPNKQRFANIFIEEQDMLKQHIPADYDLSMNHMRKSNDTIGAVDLNQKLERFLKVKSAELLIGKQFQANDPILQDGEKFLQEIKAIFDTLIPVFTLSMREMG